MMLFALQARIVHSDVEEVDDDCAPPTAHFKTVSEQLEGLGSMTLFDFTKMYIAPTHPLRAQIAQWVVERMADSAAPCMVWTIASELQRLQFIDAEEVLTILVSLMSHF
jgi:hypothetical protein